MACAVGILIVAGAVIHAERVFLFVTELRRALARVLVPDVAVIANAEEAFEKRNALFRK